MTTQSTASHAHEFRAEIKQLLNILIHSVYTSTDIFVRELISNATDALEKVRFSQVQGKELYCPDLPLEIRIETKNDGDQPVLVISDSGIGMTLEDVHENIGTIARSGAATFLERLKAAGSNEEQKLSLIGQFGVGFYSVFMAADKVILTSRSSELDGQTVIWTSEGMGTYSAEAIDEHRDRGTRIEVFLKKDAARFADADTIKSTIKKFSNFVPFPVLVNDEQVNQTTAVWREPEENVSESQYGEFFKLVTHENEDPLLRLRVSVDAPYQFTALLFVPSANREAMGFGEGRVNIQLYVKRVLIDPENKHVLPNYLRFVRGIVESEDLPLNISRETLQENKIVSKIRENLTRRLLDLFIELGEQDSEKYQRFWQAFGRNLKEGYNDYGQLERLQELLRFNSSRQSNVEGMESLKQYCDGFVEGQEAIYYLSGPSRAALEKDPRLELFRKKNIEVLYLYDVADEWVLGNLGTYNEKQLVSADQVKTEDLKEIGSTADDREGDDSAKPDPAEIDSLVVRFREILGDRVIDVRVSERLVDSPACLVVDENQFSAHMDKVMRRMHKRTDLPQRILEVNPNHTLIGNLARIVQKDRDDPLIEAACVQLFEGSMLADGYLSDPHEFVERMNGILASAAELKSNSFSDNAG